MATVVIPAPLYLLPWRTCRTRSPSCRERDARVGRFNGPPDSGNGGYSCGLVAGLVGAGVEVTLRSPPPLERELPSRSATADAVDVLDGDSVVAEARPAELDSRTSPTPVPRRGDRGGEPRGRRALAATVTPFTPASSAARRASEGDGLRMFPVALPGRDGLFGASWPPGRVARGRRTAACARNRLGGAGLPHERADRGLGSRARRRAGAARRPHRRPGARGRASTSPRPGRSARTAASASAAAALYDDGGAAVACASRALWIELRSTGE